MDVCRFNLIFTKMDPRPLIFKVQTVVEEYKNKGKYKNLSIQYFVFSGTWKWSWRVKMKQGWLSQESQPPYKEFVLLFVCAS